METNAINNWNMASEIELMYRSKVKASCRPRLSSGNEVYELLKKHWNQNKIELVEEFKVIYMNNAQRVLGILDVSTGSTVATIVDPRLIFATALKLNAAKIILSHNHPSGNLHPSEQDKTMTKKLIEGGRFFDIQILDHVILTNEGYFSFANEGLIG